MSEALRRILHSKEEVTVVGGGISGLMTAYHLMQDGYKVRLITKSPNPEIQKAESVEASTWDGLDQRYLTIFEGHPYLEFINYVCAVYPEIGKDFQTQAIEGGWLALPINEFNEQTQKWLAQRAELNAKLQAGEEAAIVQVSADFAAYTTENRASMVLWYDMLQDLINQHPKLATELLINYGGIIRLYDTEEVLQAAIKSHEKEGLLKRSLTPQELADEMPAYAAGVENGFIKGGAVEMHGLAIGVQSFCKVLTKILEKGGVEFSYDTAIAEIKTDEKGKVECLLDDKGNEVRSKHYSFHTGAYSGGIFKDLLPEATNKPADLAAMEGYWIEIKPKTASQEEVLDITDGMAGKANKVHGKQSIAACLERVSPALRELMVARLEKVGVNAADFDEITPTVDFNIMPIYKGNDVSIGIGSGYVFVGIGERDAQTGKVKFGHSDDAQEFTQIMMQLWIAALYGEDLLDACDIDVKTKACIRSWSVFDSDKFPALETSDGGKVVFAGGGNTGTTTKAHIEALRALEVISGEEQIKTLQAQEMPVQNWERLEHKFHCAVVNSQASRFKADWLNNALAERESEMALAS